MTLGANEFLRRFFLHVLPRGFVHIRHFGFLANRFRCARLALCRQLLSSPPSTLAETETCNPGAESSSLCPRCGAAMIVVQRFTAAELSTCTYFDSSYRVHHGRPRDVLPHAGALVCLPHRDRFPRHCLCTLP
jgi:hypothetical protein